MIKDESTLEFFSRKNVATLVSLLSISKREGDWYTQYYEAMIIHLVTGVSFLTLGSSHEQI